MKWQISALVLTAGVLIAADKPSDDVKKTLEKLQGTWKIEKAQRSGEVTAQEIIKALSVVIKDDKITVKDGSRDEDGQVRIDPTKSPATIDILTTRGAKETVQGIYEVEGDTLKLCW